MHPITPSHPITLRSILILSSHIRLGLPSGLFHSRFATKILYAFLISAMRATCSAHTILIDSFKGTLTSNCRNDRTISLLNKVLQ